MITVQDMWAGTDESLQVFGEIQIKIAAKGAEQAQPTPPLLQINGSTGIINIKGPISNVDSPWNALFGATSYPAINEALVSAASNPAIKSVLLDIDSGGGSVSGVAESADLISRINTQIKPVTAYTGGSALSAAYWLASSAGHIFASKVSSTGSVGVILTHAENSAQLKEDGIAVTVLRAGKYKALASPHEPLTQDAKDQLQGTLDAAYNVFADHVAKARGMSMPVFEATAGQGRVFFGANAQQAGLIDGVMSFSEVFNAVTRQTLDKSKLHAENIIKIEGVNPMSQKPTLTEQDIAAIAAGASVEFSSPNVEVAAEVEAVVDAPVVEAVTPQLAYLEAQLAAKDAALIDVKVELKSLKDRFAQVEAQQAPILAIVGKSIANMSIAMGATSIGIEGRSAADIVAEHERLSLAFSTKFKAGGVAATAAAESLKAESPQADSLHKARIAATHTHFKGA